MTQKEMSMIHILKTNLLPFNNFASQEKQNRI